MEAILSNLLAAGALITEEARVLANIVLQHTDYK